MKKHLYLLMFLASVNFLSAQISFNYRYSGTPGNISGPYLDKLSLSGYKYVLINNATKVIQIYNTNHSLYKSINIPTLTLPSGNVSYISETLFDNDSQIEYAYWAVNTGTTPPKFYVFKENGTQVFFRDSASISYNSYNNSTWDTQPIVFDGTKTVMRLTIGLNAVGYEYYTLPGSLPCVVCTNGSITSVARQDVNTGNTSDPIFYPNPASTQLKLKYELPKSYKSAVIEVRDSQGKQLESYKVTDVFDHLYLPQEYNNGLYFYSLVVDGVIIKTEKIILHKD